MKISYDPTIKVCGIGILPWPRLGPEDWLDNYAIASIYGWDLSVTQTKAKNYSLVDRGIYPQLERKNSDNLLKNKQFIDMLNEELPDYNLLTYRPLENELLKNRKFLANNPKYSDMYENKANFRNRFYTKLNFPEYTITDINNLKNGQLKRNYQFVLQDEILSGGKGTYLVNSARDIEAFTDHVFKYGRRVVISKFVEDAQELSLQVVITKFGTFYGPFTRQYINIPELVNPNLKKEKFCGGEVDLQLTNSDLYLKAVESAKIIAEDMKRQRYKGIFGVDFLYDSKNLYVSEVNARLTGLTPLLGSIYSSKSDLPYYLLQLLELGDYPYKIEDSHVQHTKSGSILLLHNLSAKTIKITSVPDSGTYELEDNKLKFVSPNIKLSVVQEKQFIIQQYMPLKSEVKSGLRLINLLYSRPSIDKKPKLLYNDVKQAIIATRQAVKTTEVI